MGDARGPQAELATTPGARPVPVRTPTAGGPLGAFLGNARRVRPVRHQGQRHPSQLLKYTPNGGKRSPHFDREQGVALVCSRPQRTEHSSATFRPLACQQWPRLAQNDLESVPGAITAAPRSQEAPGKL